MTELLNAARALIEERGLLGADNFELIGSEWLDALEHEVCKAEQYIADAIDSEERMRG